MPHVSTAEIDDIFSSKSTPSRIISPTIRSEGEKKKKRNDAAVKDASRGTITKKNKKKKVSPHQTASHTTDSPAETSSSSTARSSVNRKRPEPETVHDPSAALLLSRSAKRMKTTKGDPSAESGKIKKDRKDDEDKFRDSRGTRPRKRTEEGYPIYTEEELGIREAGGDTPLCPFDCDCCF